MSTLKEVVEGDFPWLKRLVDYVLKVEQVPVTIQRSSGVRVIKPRDWELEASTEGLWEYSQYKSDKNRDCPSVPDVRSFRFFWVVLSPEGAKPILVGPTQSRAVQVSPDWIGVETVTGLIVRLLAESLGNHAKEIVLSGEVGVLRLADITHLIQVGFYLKAEYRAGELHYSLPDDNAEVRCNITVAKLEQEVVKRFGWESTPAWHYYPTRVELFQ